MIWLGTPTYAQWLSLFAINPLIELIGNNPITSCIYINIYIFFSRTISIVLYHMATLGGKGIF